MILILHIVAITIALACGNPAKRQTLAPLDAFNTQELDEMVRRKLVFMVVNHINDTMLQEQVVQNACERQINSTADTCKSCAAASQGTVVAAPNPLEAVLPVLLQSALKSGSLVEFLANTLTNKAVIGLLGKETIVLAKELEGVANTAGKVLLGGAKDVLDGALGGLKGLGDKLTDLTSGIGHGLENAVTGLTSGTVHFGQDLGHQLEHIGGGLINGAQHTANQIAHGATDVVNSVAHGATDVINSVAHGAEHVGQQIAHGVHDIGHALGGIFGKRSACPSCDKISSKDGNTIVSAVCGASFIAQIQKTESQINNMKIVYSSSVNDTIVQKVEYDPTSIDTTHGVQFTSVYVTYNINGHPVRFSSDSHLQLTNLPAMADGLAQEIFSRFVQ